MALCTQNRCADQTALHLVSPPPEHYRSTRSMNTQTELAHSFGHREAITSWPLFLFQNLPPALYGFFESPYLAGALTFFGWLFHLNLKIRRAPGLWTLRPLRSGFEPLTQGFSVLCSNQLSYLNNCYLPYWAIYVSEESIIAERILQQRWPASRDRSLTHGEALLGAAFSILN